MADEKAAARIARLDEIMRQVPESYVNRLRLRQDVCELLQTVPSLLPHLQDFDASGRKLTLFFLFGVLPIQVSGSTYNIPMTWYFDPPYPRQPPRCFITPNAGMALKSSHAHVDTGGQIYIPYLSTWNERSSTLTQLASVMTSVFSAKPPVYATGAKQPAPSADGTSRSRGFSIGGLFGAADPPPHAVAGDAASRGRSAGAVPLHMQPQPFRLPHLAHQATSRTADGDRRVSPRRRTATEDTPARSSPGPNPFSQFAALAERGGRHEAELRDAEPELRHLVQSEAGWELDPDEFRDGADPDGRQVIDLLAEELALEDLVAAIDELFAAGRIGIDDMLREVREASRKQFLCRWQRRKAAAAVAAASRGLR